MLYARDDEMFDADTHNVTPGPDVGYIHRVLFDDSIASIATLYREPRHYNAIAASGHAAVVMDDYGGRVVIYHRPGAHSAGYLLEVSCGGRIESSYSEQWLILGDSARVQIASPHALQWTAGIVAVPDGWLVAIHRFLTRGFYDVDENQLKTEIFTYRHGRLEGSVVVDGQWILTDYSSRFGVLMATAVPAPHFIRVPLIALVPSSDREIE
jgi:hypothetical protein